MSSVLTDEVPRVLERNGSLRPLRQEARDPSNVLRRNREVEDPVTRQAALMLALLEKCPECRVVGERAELDLAVVQPCGEPLPLVH